jgi:hypothetical protein
MTKSQVNFILIPIYSTNYFSSIQELDNLVWLYHTTLVTNIRLLTPIICDFAYLKQRVFIISKKFE